MDKEMSEREAFENYRVSNFDIYCTWEGWQAACKWQRQNLAAWIKPQRNDIPATGEEFAAAILNQGSKE